MIFNGMITKRFPKIRFGKALFGCLFGIIGVLSLTGAVAPNNVYADPVDETVYVDEAGAEAEGEVTEVEGQTEEGQQIEAKSCEDGLGSLAWLVCPTTGKISEAVDWLYDKIEEILVINPVSAEDGSPIYEIWKYMRGITNIVFIIFLLVVIYSQITGVGISNYGIKKALPKLIVVAVLVNLSFIICSLAVDASNIIGNGLRGVFTSVEESTLATANFSNMDDFSLSGMYAAVAGGGAVAGIVAFETGAIWMLIPTVLGAIAAVVIGLVTIALRQAVVALLVMIAPLAVVAYMLPNTEQWFKKWRQLLIKMLTFYPMFSLLFGASSLAGWAIIASAKSGFWVLLGVAVQIFPLFFSWNLMKMSGTFLSNINTRFHGLAARPLATNRGWADSHRQLSRQKYLASEKAYTPSLRLMQFMSNRKIAREEETGEYAAKTKLRGQAYNVDRKYNKRGMPGRDAEEDYAMQAKNMEYMRTIERHKNNMNKGLGQLAVVQNASAAKKARLAALDSANVKASDMLKVEQARGEKITYDNAAGFHRRMEDAMNAHFDDVNKDLRNKNGKLIYKAHDIKNRQEAETRYKDVSNILEGEVTGIHYAAATAAQAYDTQKKIVEAKMQKYFELTPPTKDVEYRLGELTKMENAASQIDSIIPGLRILNQRGDTDLLKIQMDNVLNGNKGIELGTHASQALASFLMFEVKDNDPFLRRFGKYINLETARAYNANDRQVMRVSYDEYVKGYHDGEPELISESNPTGRMYAKKGMKQLVEGTSLDNIERTALSNLDESLKRTYGFNSSNPGADWDVEGYLRKREEIQTAFEPAFLSASLKWLSGSEQINSGVKFWTGYELKQKKDKDGNVITDENGDPEYSLSPVWNGKEFKGHEDEVEKYYRRKAGDYFKDQTTGQILGMRTDYRDANKEHMLNMYLHGIEDEDNLSEEQREEYRRRQEEYNSRKAEIQTKYGDLPLEEAEKLRSKDKKTLDMEFSGRQIRKILGETGKLKQIYRTRTSGTAINAKDWLRGWVNLDNEDALRREMNFYDEQREKKGNKISGGSGDDSSVDESGRIYKATDRSKLLEMMRGLKDEIMDEEPALFFEDTRDRLVKWFGEDTVIVKKYEQYYEHDDPRADNIELYKFVRELLEDPDNYPDA